MADDSDASSSKRRRTGNLVAIGNREMEDMKQQLRDSQNLIRELQQQLKQREDEIRVLQQNRGSATGSNQSVDGQRIASLEQLLNQRDKQMEDLVKANTKLRRELYPSECLPVECLQRIISFCDISDVYDGCMVVNKKWFEASNADLKTRKALRIEAQDGCGSRFGHTVFMTEATDRKKMVKSLLRMTGITNLHLELSEEQVKGIIRLWNKWSPNLRHLGLDNGCFPEGLGLTFPRLTSLESAGIPLRRDGGCDLPLQQIEKMNVCLSTWSRKKVDLLCSMKNVTDLKVVYSSTGTVTDMEHISLICRSFQKLVKFRLKCMPDDGEPLEAEGVNSAIASLVEMNPQLEEVSLSRLPLTDASLVSLARLKNLKRLKISANQAVDSEVTVTKLAITGPAIVNFLRTGSQHSLESVTLKRVLEIDVQTQATIEELEDEMGIVFQITHD